MLHSSSRCTSAVVDIIIIEVLWVYILKMLWLAASLCVCVCVYGGGGGYFEVKSLGLAPWIEQPYRITNQIFLSVVYIV